MEKHRILCPHCGEVLIEVPGMSDQQIKDLMIELLSSN